MLDVKILGDRIKQLRLQQGLTQSAFAEELGVSFQAVSNWERKVAPPDLENVIHIAEYFGVLVDDLLRPKAEDLFLGIDGGGTKTEFVVVSPEGTVRKRIVKTGCNPNDIGYSKMTALLHEGIGAILAEFPYVRTVFGGIAGSSAGNHAKQLCDELHRHYPQLEVQIENDSSNLFAMDETADMVVISGTGSAVFVRTREGSKRLGGWGYLLDSAGSAYDIGRDALRAALGEEDRREAPSLLRTLLLKKLDAETVWERVSTVYSEGKPYIAGLAPVVFEAAGRGDARAMQIIDRTARALAEWLNVGSALYGVRPVAVANGGLFAHYPDVLTAQIANYTDIKLIVRNLPPVYGACRRACAAAGYQMDEAFCDNFKKTYGGMER